MLLMPRRKRRKRKHATNTFHSLEPLVKVMAKINVKRLKMGTMPVVSVAKIEVGRPTVMMITKLVLKVLRGTTSPSGTSLGSFSKTTFVIARRIRRRCSERSRS